MNLTRKVWHMRLGPYARAFAPTPTTSVAAITWFARGWRPFNGQWWSKPSPNQKRLERLREGVER